MKTVVGILFFCAISVNAIANENLNYGADFKVKWRQVGSEGEFKNEAALQARYEEINTWADAKLKLSILDACSKNGAMGMDLERCLIGYAIDTSAAGRLFAEVGREKMEHLFESKLQYKSSFNGLHLGFQNANWQIHGGPHVVDSDMEHYGAVGEVIYYAPNDPLIVSYSITHWMPSLPYTISQILAKYDIGHVGDHPVTFYGAFLRNHQKTCHSNGGYVGASLGRLEFAGDFGLDLNCQYASVNAIPEIDFNGIEEGWHMQCKAIYMLTDHFSLEGKMSFGTDIISEFAAVYKW